MFRTVLSRLIPMFATFLFVSPLFAQQYAGSWAGTTAQGRNISFEISGSAFTTLGISATAGGCTFTTVVTYTTPRSFSGNMFTLSSSATSPGSTTFTVIGTFNSATSASGTMSAKYNGIPGVSSSCGPIETTWTASKEGSPPGLPLAGILAVAGSLPGAFGSFFKTELQLHNPGTSNISGKLVFHRAGASGSANDPSLDYSLAPGESRSYADLLPAMNQSGIGSIDLMTSDRVPIAVARIFNDGGDAGTTGMAVDPIDPVDALKSGDNAVLISPSDPSRFRFNIGVRTLSAGANVMVTVRDKNGQQRTTVSKNYPPDFFEQVAVRQLIGIDLGDSDTVTFSINSGSAIIYGSATDNTTQDPTLQYAKRTF